METPRPTQYNKSTTPTQKSQDNNPVQADTSGSASSSRAQDTTPQNIIRTTSPVLERDVEQGPTLEDIQAMETHRINDIELLTQAYNRLHKEDGQEILKLSVTSSLAASHYRHKNRQEFENYAQEAEKYYESLKDLNTLEALRAIFAYCKLSVYLHKAPENQKPLAALLALKEQLEEIEGEEDIKGLTYYYLGHCHSDIEKTNEAIDFYNKALQHLEQLEGYQKELGNAYRNLGNIHSFLGDNKKGLEYKAKALPFLEQVTTAKFPLADCYHSLGVAERDLLQRIDYFQKAVAANPITQHSDQTDISIALDSARLLNEHLIEMRTLIHHGHNFSS